MAWYTKYVEYFGKPYDTVSKDFMARLKDKLKDKQQDNPVASISVIAYNEESRMLACLWSLAENRCKYPIEIYGVDNNSTDRTATIFQELGLKYYTQPKRGCGNARQCGLDKARGKYFLSIDADAIYPRDYIQTMIEELEKPGVVAATTLTGFIPDQQNSRLGLRIYEAIRGVHLRILFRKRPELCVRGMAFGYLAEIGKSYGYRTELIRGEDGSMALRLKDHGKIALVTKHKVRGITGTNTPLTGKSQLGVMFSKVTDALADITAYFKKKAHYEDKDSNLMKED